MVYETKKHKHARAKILLAFFMLLTFLLIPDSRFLIPNSSYAQSEQKASVGEVVCGDGIISGNEQCDGSDLAGQTCSSRGYTGGTLSCKADCTFNTSACTSGGGGGGGYVAPVTRVVFSGRAYPNSTVIILKDAQIAATVIADQNGNFSATLSGLTTGNYIFAVYAKDGKGKSSPLLTFPKSIISGITIYIKDIIIPPPIEKEQPLKGDLNNDQKVNLVDVSILLFWFDKTPVPAKIDLNNDGKADLTDLSIIAYYWTG